MCLAREILRHARVRHLAFPDCLRRIATSPDETRHAIGNHRADAHYVAVFQRRQGVVLRAAEAAIDQHDVGIAPAGDDAAVEPVNFGVVAGCHRHRELRRHSRERSEVTHRVEHAERHDARTGWRVGGDQQALLLAGLAQQFGDQQRGAQITSGADLHRDIAFVDQAGKVGVGHGNRAAVNVIGHVGLHLDHMIGPDAG